MKPGATGLTRIFHATRYSIQGLKAAWKNEAAIRQEIGLLVIFVPITFFLPVTKLEQIALIVSLLLILLVELVNSAIEAVVDRIGPEHHELSGRAKDIGSAAVMIALIIAGVVWGGIVLF